jgi:hypothetical protein
MAHPRIPREPLSFRDVLVEGASFAFAAVDAFLAFVGVVADCAGEEADAGAAFVGTLDVSDGVDAAFFWAGVVVFGTGVAHVVDCLNEVDQLLCAVGSLWLGCFGRSFFRW